MADEVVVLNGARTPFGEFCGSLKNLSATELGVKAASEAIKRSGEARLGGFLLFELFPEP